MGAVCAFLVTIALSCSSSGGHDSPSSPVRSASPTTLPGHPTGPSAGCRSRHTARPGTTDAVIESGGAQRHYQLTVPAGYDGRQPRPLVLALHSLTIDYHVVPMSSGLTGPGDQRHFITVAPSGLLGPDGLPYWNAAPVKTNDDVAFISTLLDHLEATLCVDTGKVISIGMSNGAQMSSLSACRLAGRIDGIGPIAGVEYSHPCDTAPTPVIAFHGAKDPIVPYGGGGLDSVRIADENFYEGHVPADTTTSHGVDAAMRGWARHNHCDPEPASTKVASDVEKRTWKGCAAPTELYVVTDGGHAWPGMCFPGFEATMGHCTEDIDATDLILASLLGPTGH